MTASAGYNATSIQPQKGFRIHLIVFLLSTPAIWLVWYLTDRTYPWPLWSTPAWAVGVLFHYLGVYVFKKSKTHNIKA
ncbi:2TM domain-containing protein [Taibaiella helva]|uniref:2TM domain-containing protein n=1 Tax=Taibaiella helva TaxID=2301235 RepID=UPI00130058C4|nr:2TM domain-containing protein [Taibaiella helva]